MYSFQDSYLTACDSKEESRLHLCFEVAGAAHLPSDLSTRLRRRVACGADHKREHPCCSDPVPITLYTKLTFKNDCDILA